MLDTITTHDERFHPVANIFPLLEGEAFDCLVQDIQTNGLRDPIVEYEGLILYGRNRFRGCLKAGVEPRLVPFAGKDPISFVLSKNLHRRHLNESQRAMIAVRLVTLGRGRPGNASIEAISQPAAAKLLSVGRSTVQRAVIVRNRAASELVTRVDRGEISVSLAANLAANLSQDQQLEVAEKPEAFLRGAVKQAVRAQRERSLAKATMAASMKLGKSLYSVIMADPPWRFEPHSRVTGMAKAADNHYPTMTLDEIVALDVPAAETCVLFMWRTAPMLKGAMDVMAAWGFESRLEIVWEKDKIGTGYWSRNQHEVLMIGTRGDPPGPAPGTQPPSVIRAPVGRHSEKPAVFAEVIERMFPTVPKIEMFARQRRPGWDAWGNEVQAISAR